MNPELDMLLNEADDDNDDDDDDDDDDEETVSAVTNTTTNFPPQLEAYTEYEYAFYIVYLINKLSNYSLFQTLLTSLLT